MRSGAQDGATELARLRAGPAAAERLVAELHSRGTLGIEERAGADGAVELLAYFAPGAIDAASLAELARAVSAELLGLERVEPVDWDVEWRRGLEPRRIGPLWVRPSWCPAAGRPEIVIDPRQAFGSGEHATTQLALELLLETLRAGESVLDVGTGSGILGLGALRMGAGAALGLDVDPVAVADAAQQRRHNGLDLTLYCGALDALDPGARFGIVVANVLLQHLAPWLGALQAHARRAVILSGYLGAQRAELDAQLAPGWRVAREVEREQSGDLWCARLLLRASPGTGPRRAAP